MNDDQTKPKTQQKAPFPIRIPDGWEADIMAVVGDQGLSKHAYILRQLRRGLDRDLKAVKRREASNGQA